NLKYIALIAERHSGSTWMVQFLQSYFRGKNITVTPTLCTWKRTCVERQQCPACKDINHTLVVVIWRNPYDWISGMHKIPWHANVILVTLSDRCCCVFTGRQWASEPPLGHR
ncbi:unnamed protein product, partial [Hapterophycus canaliculatus]